jgi:hypothetical protein
VLCGLFVEVVVNYQVHQSVCHLLQGYLVDMPLNFLSGENLMPTATSVQGIMPTVLWT